MKVFNKIVVIIDIIAMIALLVLMLLSPLQIISIAQYNLGLLSDAMTTNPFWTWYVVGSIVVAVILLIIFLMEIWPRAKKSVRIRAQGRGNARISLKSVQQTLEYRVSELEGVNSVAPKFKTRGKDLAVTLVVDAAPGVNIPALSDQIIDLSVRILEGELGLKLKGRMNLDINSAPVRAGGVSMRQPVAPAVASPPDSKPVIMPSAKPEAIVTPTYSASSQPAKSESNAYLDSLSAPKATTTEPSKAILGEEETETDSTASDKK